MRNDYMGAEMTVSGLDYLEQKRLEVNKMLARYLPPVDLYPQILHEAMRYSVMAGGKRIRPILCLTGYDAFNGHDTKVINPAACALELVHTYSLIHDDLPCMDDDDLRRGQPTLHKKYDEAVAVLAGDALHDLAFNLISRSGSALVVSELANATGTYGMLAGQMADLDAEKKKASLEEIRYIHIHKTAALIRASVRIGAILAGAGENDLERLSVYGEKIGLAFQIIDDILDIEGDQKKLGKEVGSDCKNEKATYPGTVGMEQAKIDAEKLIDEAILISNEFGWEQNHFEFIAQYIGRREY
ncbi:MAG: polyprenyl synthetase family protein [Candidatus Zixiibacteriota bacterium]